MSNEWISVGKVEDFCKDLGGCVKVDGKQIAVFNVKEKSEWYAVQNLCPHDNRMVLSRGLIGDASGTPKVACPLHKHNFDLKTGEHVSEGDVDDLTTYPVKVEEGTIYLQMV
ncbi:MAG: nitrite reductase small subunit NirD [Lentisphaeraceae bacterium]|nr:nitrite reductase small subunit NirD [Lentisphaeraceae bacterium]